MRPHPPVILDELAELANDCWEAYMQAAEWVAPGEPADLLAAIGRKRRDMAQAYEAEVARMGHLPRDRDTNPGIGHRLLARIKASFAGDRPGALIEECCRADNHFAHRLMTVDETMLSPAMAETLRAHHAEVVAALGRLAAARLRYREG